MAQLGLNNALEICKDYLLKIGVEKSEIDSFLHEGLFSEGYVQQLTDVSVVANNRNPASKSKQTHIHITGPSRFVFYPEKYISSITESTEDSKIDLKLINANMAHLNFLKSQGRQLDQSYFFNDHIQTIESTTVKKISARDSQVQISKKYLDGEEFSLFRDLLYPDDLLVFLKYLNAEDEYLILGIPAFRAIDLLELETEKSFKRELPQVEANQIGSYNINQDRDREDISNVDMNATVEIRLNRSIRHREMLRTLAAFLNKSGFLLFEGSIDCLAYKEGEPVLIFEAKTLNGTFSDEVHQVRDCLSQLLYYEYLESGQFTDNKKYKIAFFEKKIDDRHIKLLRKNNCYVIWLNKDSDLVGDHESLELLSKFNILAVDY